MLANTTRPPKHTFELARKHESQDNRPRYLVRDGLSGLFLIVERMPAFGEWYTSDEIQHGI